MFIAAASGTGRNLFARGWLGDDAGEIIDLSAATGDLTHNLDEIVNRLTSDPDLRIVVIGRLSACDWLVNTRFDCVVAIQRDLLLTRAELSSALAADQATTNEIYAQTGGWLGPSRAMSGSLASRASVYQLIRSGLYQWISQHPQATQFRQAAFLPVIDGKTLEVFYNRLGDRSFGPDELRDSGIIYEGIPGEWHMPLLVRRALIEQQRVLEPESLHELELIGLDTVATVYGVEQAVDKALNKRSWKAIEHLLTERWVDLFVSNPQVLRRYVTQIPEFVINQTNYLWAALRIVASIGTDRMILPFPSIAPNYESDRAAQRLLEQTTKMYRRPGARALTAGLLEITHLRLAGLYEESANAAMRLRAAAHTANNIRRINPKLISTVELQSGISLELQGRDVEAKWAYTAAYRAAQETGNHFQLADATGRLALICVKQNDNQTAQRWLEEHQESADLVDWGQSMVGRGAALTRAHIALTALDTEQFYRELASLPAETDSDEFWAVHTLLLAVQAILKGQITDFKRLLSRLYEERIYAFSDMSAELMEQSRQLLVLTGHLEEIDPAHEHGAAEFRALMALRTGQPDRALFLLELAKSKPLSQRYSSLHVYLEMAARRIQGPSEQDLIEIKAFHAAQGRLLDLVLLSTIPSWSNVLDSLGLDAVSISRVRQIQQAFPTPDVVPELTERESELLQLLREGLSRRQIATNTFRSENTIKTQLRGLYRKLGAADGIEALERARAIGL